MIKRTAPVGKPELFAVLYAVGSAALGAPHMGIIMAKTIIEKDAKTKG